MGPPGGHGDLGYDARDLKRRVSCAQVGNLTQDVAWWGRPEDMTAERNPRPAYFAYTAEGASDLAGQLVGALASASLAIGAHGRDPADAAYAAQLLQQARALSVDLGGLRVD